MEMFSTNKNLKLGYLLTQWIHYLYFKKWTKGNFYLASQLVYIFQRAPSFF